MTARSAPALGMALMLLAGCQNSSSDGAINADTAEAFSGVSVDEVLYFGGNEPFWGGEATGESLRYTTPENIEGDVIAVKRFAGLGGLSLSGELNGAPFDMLVTDSSCDDTMADRSYPFTITLKIGEETRAGCGWTDARPFTGDGTP